MMTNDYEDMLCFISEQMSAKAGIKRFGKRAENAIMAELHQIVYRQVMEGVPHDKLTREDKKRALQYLIFIKEKRNGRMKGRGCADGHKQRLYKTKEETSSPTVTLEDIFLTCMT